MKKIHIGQLGDRLGLYGDNNREKWKYEYQTSKKIGEFSFTGHEGALELKGEIASKINALLYISSRGITIEGIYTLPKFEGYENTRKLQRNSNCHITSNYLLGIDNELGNIKSGFSKGGVSWDHNIYDKDGTLYDLKEYTSLEGVIQNNVYPIICRIIRYGKPEHSIIILGEMKEQKILGFEQAGIGGEWNFCDVRDSIDRTTFGSSRGIQLFCKSI